MSSAAWKLGAIIVPAELVRYFPVYESGETVDRYIERIFNYNGQPDTWAHCQAVAAEAQRLARRYNVDTELAVLAGWLHDVSTVIPDAAQWTLACQYGLATVEAERQVPFLLHQRLSAWIAEHVMGYDDDMLLQVIDCHTTLRGDLELLDKLLFVADKLSWADSDAAPYIAAMRAVADVSLEQAIDVYMRAMLSERGKLAVVHPWLAAACHTLAMEQYWRSLPALCAPIQWGPVTAHFRPRTALRPAQQALVSNVSIMPLVGDQVVMIRLTDGRWELPGGTLEPGELPLEGLRREVREEMGGELLDYTLFGCFECKSAAATAYRAHIPHPYFIRMAGYGQVRLDGQPLNPPDGEQIETVAVVTIEEAERRFRSTGRADLADFYLIGYKAWQLDDVEK
ncbi:bis(5'-nucleosyl)-tetraphosphatase (symmetrical) YqeK [Paenibacillus campi]|uniref:bis(5'-nucleosyl)-tetraphosphatase (symmetrical) YqeK n=1 Tax=Paenibacillus campi TaxID=3106031 RepID=UPI002AFF550B|nr:bis(5'-nucleosyl)-tetraphosphatase (symmetrical) YqeK [Paenibacillus sp. SGZ-1009]